MIRVQPQYFMEHLQLVIDETLSKHDRYLTILVKNHCELALVKQLVLMRIHSDWKVDMQGCTKFSGADGFVIRTDQGHYIRIQYTDNQNQLRGLSTSVFTTFEPSGDFINCIVPVEKSSAYMSFHWVDEPYAG